MTKSTKILIVVSLPIVLTALLLFVAYMGSLDNAVVISANGFVHCLWDLPLTPEVEANIFYLFYLKFIPISAAAMILAGVLGPLFFVIGFTTRKKTLFFSFLLMGIALALFIIRLSVRLPCGPAVPEYSIAKP